MKQIQIFKVIDTRTGEDVTKALTWSIDSTGKLFYGDEIGGGIMGCSEASEYYVWKLIKDGLDEFSDADKKFLEQWCFNAL